MMTQMTQMTQGGEGNTSPPPRVIRGRKWCFTLNNYTEEEYNDLKTKMTHMTQYILGKEIGEDKKTPHIQGYIEFKCARTFTSIKKLIPRAHIEKAKGNKKSNYDYCSKGGDFATNIDFRTAREKLKDEVLADEYKEVKWHSFQQDIINIVDGVPDKRKIHWFYEPNGNVGKSYLCKYLALTRNVIVCEGKKNDIFQQVAVAIERGEIPHIVLCDVPRTANEYLNYGAIEQLKNGMMYSGKYEGGLCIFKIPHVICFSNEEPNRNALSEDRWDIILI